MDTLVVFIHILAGTVLVSMSAIMQLIVGPAVAEIKDPATKQRVTDKLKKVRIPVMDSAIVIQILTALILLKSRWTMISTEPLMQVKAVAGTAALSLAFLSHFYIRRKRLKLEMENQKEEVAELNRKNRIIEKLVLLFGLTTFLLGLYFNHM